MSYQLPLGALTFCGFDAYLDPYSPTGLITEHRDALTLRVGRLIESNLPSRVEQLGGVWLVVEPFEWGSTTTDSLGQKNPLVLRISRLREEIAFARLNVVSEHRLAAVFTTKNLVGH